MLKFKNLVFTLSLISLYAYGQNEALFVIASHSEGVLLDEAPAYVGQLVYSTSKQLTIPKKGYALLILRKGYAHKYTRSISIKQIKNDIIAFDGFDKQRLTFGRYPYGHSPNYQISLIGVPQNQFANIFGDSILIAIKSNNNRIRPPYKIQFSNMFGDVLSSDSINTNWKVYGVKAPLLLPKEKHMLFQVTGNGISSNEQFIRLLEDARVNPLKESIAQIINSGSSDLLKVAIFEDNNLLYDQMFLLYQLTRANYLPENEVLADYFNALKRRYNFELFDFRKR